MPEQRALHEPFHHPARQRQADRLGMILFLASEAMLFGGLFAAAMALRLLYPADYVAASGHLKLWLGTANTAILLTSSLMAAVAVETARGGRPRLSGYALVAAILLGLLFLGIKGYEYGSEYREGLIPGLHGAHFEGRVQHLFMNFYFVSTGLHALHVIGGIALLTIAAFSRAARQDRTVLLIGNAALYWHLVDIIWVFLYPTLYLPDVS
ncbi:cytochrome c oxidase subunit 3 [Sphingobium estronivorans]|uniref:cytochrome c oxidase subunit 3 n=1 Tax=Sphingobium estronivorans TaxID=1577690 RepID=UPI00123A2F07|nr:cytochrome c oxidase subunit 3 [Sphingobium estronivorans]